MLFGDRDADRLRCHLDGDEVILTSLTGLEPDGRRRRVAAVTDRRILVVWFRGGAPVELSFDGVACTYDRSGRLLELRQGDEVVALRVDDGIRARAFVEVVIHHRHGALDAARTRRSLRVVSG